MLLLDALDLLHKVFHGLVLFHAQEWSESVAIFYQEVSFVDFELLQPLALVETIR